MWPAARRRLVRVHMLDNAPSIEGVLVGRPNGFYRLLKPAVLEAPGRSQDAEGEAWVPRERVLWVQILG